ncbi:F-box domain [Pseudocohnilembus persalinus]|uniref:F-box domain n=1 Tax=Pseudocohnilembus persalinus TaxID=266149 RepID=A0A0V0R1Z8_PSEPJ|nr:F-box domain [Pseudocohnilembus persalinus]|eukprot:KRX08540.1 F-box domain [Pseudocohnilembus persalinus]
MEIQNQNQHNQKGQQGQNYDQINDQEQTIISQETHLANLPQKNNKSNYQKNFKQILKTFQHKFDKHELWMFYEFAQFEPELVFFMLQNYSQQFMLKLKREFMKKPQNANKILYEIINKYCHSKGIKDWDEHLIAKEQQYDEQNEEKKNNNQDENNQQEENKSEDKETEIVGLIMELSDGIIIKIFEFLDPKSLGKMQICNSRFKKLAREQFLWKKICLQIIKPGLPKLPEITPFTQYQAIVMARPMDYKREFYQAVCQDVRKAIWYEPENDFKTNATYFKQFENWYSMYLSAPRVNYGGIYQLKEIIMKIGQIEYGHHFAPSFGFYEKIEQGKNDLFYARYGY